MEPDQLADAVGHERQTAREAMEEQHADRVDVGSRAGGSTLEELGRHEGRRAGQGGAPLGQVFEPTDQPEIRQLRVALGRDQHIRRLDVPMDQSRLVRRTEGQDHLARQDRGAGRFERTLANQGLPQGLAPGDILHLDEMVAVDASQVVDRHDVRMEQVGSRTGLRPELLSVRRVLTDLIGIQDLQAQCRCRPRCFALYTQAIEPVAEHRLRSGYKPILRPISRLGKSPRSASIVNTHTTGDVLHGRVFER